MNDPHDLIEDELMAIRQSGEMPEVALHSALHYLREDPAGPGVTLAPEDMLRLKDAVEARYRRILLRDLNPRYRDKPIYRGLSRAMANWQRLVRFCERDRRDVGVHRQAAAAALYAFLAVETKASAAGRTPSAVDCTADELAAFALALGLKPETLPGGWEKTCV